MYITANAFLKLFLSRPADLSEAQAMLVSLPFIVGVTIMCISSILDSETEAGISGELPARTDVSTLEK